MSRSSVNHRPRRQVSATSGRSAETSQIHSTSRFGGFRSGSTSVGFGVMRLWVVVGLLACVWIEGAKALDQKYCSSQNTGLANYTGSDQWMSLGLCRTRCEDFAFGVVRGYDCWCADYVPNPSKNKTDCNKKCPQYDLEYCGNTDSGSYGYIDSPTLKPKGTASDSSASSTVSAPTTSKTSSLPSTRTSAISSSHESEPETTLITSTSQKSQGTTQSPTPTSPWVSVITIDGPPKTVTFTPSGWVDPTAAPDSTDNGGFFSNTGRVAGVFTVIAILVIALVLATIWFIRRQRSKGAPLGADSPTPDSFGGVMIAGTHDKRRSRSMSTLGLVTPFSGSDKPPPIVTTNSASSGSQAQSAITPDRVTDQRLDPGQVWMRFENDNASRMSVRSLRDDQDYSRRVLRLANPDE
ncbi:hypothetical protein DFH27DRAFT_19816 [Peziza echinospora]|nr:hypothetical protein DFH27DRAFT_19816 [Peziza echinospora]